MTFQLSKNAWSVHDFSSKLQNPLSVATCYPSAAVGAKTPTPRPRVPFGVTGRTRCERSSEKSTGILLPGKEYSRKSWSPGRGQRLPQPQRSGASTGRWGAGHREGQRDLRAARGTWRGKGQEAEAPEKVLRLLRFGGDSPTLKPCHQRGKAPDRHSRPRRATAGQGPQFSRSRERLTWEVGQEDGAFLSPLSPAHRPGHPIAPSDR